MRNGTGYKGRLLGWGLIGFVLVFAGMPGPVYGQKIHKDSFESPDLSWIKGSGDVEFVEKIHIRTNKAAYDGQRSEYLQIEAKNGSQIQYIYPVGKAPCTEELSIGLWLKANRPQMQILARVVFPHQENPNSIQDRLTTLIRGDVYRLVGRWQKLVLNTPTALVREQQQLMQPQLKRPINIKDAYIDALILNVYGGPGLNEIWVDELEVGPIVTDPFQESAPQGKVNNLTSQGSISGPPIRTLAVEFNGSHLLVGRKRFFLRGIRYTNTPLAVLRNAGFNTLWVDEGTPPPVLKEAVEHGFWLVPSLPVPNPQEKQFVSQNEIGVEVSRFPQSEAVLMWDLGRSLIFEQSKSLDHKAQLVRAADPGRPVSGDVWDGFLPYSRSLDVLGVHRWPLMTDLDLSGYKEWLDQRRRLTKRGTFLWTWVQTHTPSFFTNLLYQQSAEKPFEEPIGPQPAQIRLLTYTALGSSCRGIGFWSDRFLADSHQGRDRLNALALLNKELEMLEPFLVTIDDKALWVKTSEEDVMAAVYRTSKGVLVLPIWFGKGAQFVPGQSAARNLEITVPLVPQGTQAWEVTPGEVRGLQAQRVVGGTKVTLPEFGLTTAVIFTADTDFIGRFQQFARITRKQAAGWTHEQAKQEFLKVVKIQEQLERQGQSLPQAQALLQNAQNRLDLAKTYWDRHLYSEAYREAQRALRPLRMLMRAQWEKAVEGLDSPVSSPYAVSYYTLPRHWEFVNEIRQTSPGENVLPGGDFEEPANQNSGWFPQQTTRDDVVLKPQRVGQDVTGTPVEAKSGKLCARLQITPKDTERTPGALERTFLAVHSPEVRLEPGTLVEISAWVHIPEKIQASADGVLFYESIGGEPLAIRLTEQTPWKKLSLYRRVPADGKVRATLALSGLGTAYFDDIQIRPLMSSSR